MTLSHVQLLEVASSASKRPPNLPHIQTLNCNAVTFLSGLPRHSEVKNQCSDSQETFQVPHMSLFLVLVKIVQGKKEKGLEVTCNTELEMFFKISRSLQTGTVS